MMSLDGLLREAMNSSTEFKKEMARFLDGVNTNGVDSEELKQFMGYVLHRMDTLESRIATQSTQNEMQNTQITEQNTQIASQNTQIAAQNTQIHHLRNDFERLNEQNHALQNWLIPIPQEAVRISAEQPQNVVIPLEQFLPVSQEITEP